MSERVKPRRPYRSSVRAEQAQRTRARILDAARTSFLERGFSATTIAAVAEQAGVAPETVYAAYRNKAGLLESVVLRGVHRDGESDDVLDRRWVKELLGLPELPARLAALARHTAATVKLTSPMYAVIREAGELNGLQRQLLEMRFREQHKVMAAIAKAESLPSGLTVEDAADTFSALASPELHHILTVDRGWSQRRYARWLERTVESALTRCRET
jgi:AcrR family transcriptional regulator